MTGEHNSTILNINKLFFCTERVEINIFQSALKQKTLSLCELFFFKFKQYFIRYDVLNGIKQQAQLILALSLHQGQVMS